MILDRPRLIFEILRDALVLYRADWRTYLPVVALVVIPAELLVSGVGMGQLSGPYDSTPSPAETLVPLFLQQFVTFPLATAMVIAIVLGRLRDESVPARAAIREGLDVFAPLLVVVILVFVVTVAGLIGLIVGAIYVAVRMLVTVPAVVIEGRRGGAALERSWALVKDSWWRSLGTVLVLNVVGVLASSLVVFPLTAAAQDEGVAWPALIGSSLALILTVPLTAIGTTLLFGDLRARKAARDGDPDTVLA